jgi:hypothetical protein
MFCLSFANRKLISCVTKKLLKTFAEKNRNKKYTYTTLKLFCFYEKLLLKNCFMKNCFKIVCFIKNVLKMLFYENVFQKCFLF